MNDALIVALPVGLGGGLLAAATPEIAAAAQAAIQSCADNVVLCLNSAGIQRRESIEIEYFCVMYQVKVFNECVMSRFAWFDKCHLYYYMRFCPLCQNQ